MRAAGRAGQWLGHVHDRGEKAAAHVGDMVERFSGASVQVRAHDR